MSGITIHELSEPLKQRLFESNGMIIAKFTSRSTINAPTDEIEIGISGFNSELDSLFVYKNSVLLTEGIDYDISEENDKIISKFPGDWGKKNKLTIFDLLVLKNIKDASSAEGVDVIDGSIIDDGSITSDKLSPELYKKLYNLPKGGSLGSMLVKASEEDYDFKWSTKTVCSVVVNTFDNKSVDGVTIKIRNIATGTVKNVVAHDANNVVELSPDVKYEISLTDKDGYQTPPPQIVTPVLGQINTIFFMYNTELTTATIALETEDNSPVPATTVYIRQYNTGDTKEIRTDGHNNVITTNLLVNTQYQVYTDPIPGYANPPRKVFTTAPGATSNVLIRYFKDEVFCDVEITGVEVSETNTVTMVFKDLKDDREYPFVIGSRNMTVKLASNKSYEVKVMEDKPGFNKPSNRYIKTGANKSNISLSMNYELSSNTLTVTVAADDNGSVNGVDVTLTDGQDYNMTLTTGESGKVVFQVMTDKNYTISTSRMNGYVRPNSETVRTIGQNTEVSFLYKKVNVYGFSIDLNNSDPATNMRYIEGNIGFRPISLDRNGHVTYGDWLDTFITNDIKLVAIVNGIKIGELSDIEENRLTTGEAIPEDADIMVEFKKMYTSLNIQDDVLTFKISNHKIDSTFKCPAFLSEVDGKKECDYMYYGIYEAGITNNKLTSRPGATIKKFDSISAFRSAAANTGEGYAIESVAKLNYVTLLTMLVSKVTDVKIFTGKPEVITSVNSTSYDRFRLAPSGRTIGEPISIFFINNLFNTARFIDGCFINDLKEIRYRSNAPYLPETNYIMVNRDNVGIEATPYVNNVKSLFVTEDGLALPKYDRDLNSAIEHTYFASTVYAVTEEGANVNMVYNTQASASERSEPGFFNYSFIHNGQYSARLTFTK